RRRGRRGLPESRCAFERSERTEKTEKTERTERLVERTYPSSPSSPPSPSSSPLLRHRRDPNLTQRLQQPPHRGHVVEAEPGAGHAGADADRDGLGWQRVEQVLVGAVVADGEDGGRG